MKYFLLILCFSFVAFSNIHAQEDVYNSKVKLEASFDLSFYGEAVGSLPTEPQAALGIGKTLNLRSHFFIKKYIGLTLGVELGEIGIDTDELMDVGVTNSSSVPSIFKTRIYQGFTLQIPQSNDGKWNFDGTLGAGWVSYRFPTFEIFTDEKVDFSHVNGMNLFIDIGVSYKIAKSLELNLSMSQHVDLIDYSVIVDGSSFEEEATELFSNSLSLGLLYSL